ncbi:hypothetical protein AtEden1_Chr4g0285421 [Arabidopsis thaliana]
MTSRVENQDAIDAAMFGMLTVPFRLERESGRFTSFHSTIWIRDCFDLHRQQTAVVKVLS